MMDTFANAYDFLLWFGINALHGPTDLLIHGSDLATIGDFRVGELDVSPSRRTLVGPDRTISVEPRVMQLIVALVGTAGEVVTRDELLRRCWGGVYVAEESLNRAVSEARRALRDAGLQEAAIETIPKTGYRWGLPPQGPNGSAEDLPGPRRQPRSPTRRQLLAASAAVAATAGGGLWWLGRRNPVTAEVAGLVAESDQAMRLATQATNAQAIALLERAVALAPDNAKAWGRLALARARADEHAASALPGSPAAAVEKAAHRALALDKDNADAMAALAIAIPYYGDWLPAERRFEAVLAQHPEHLVTRGALSFLLDAVGRNREGSQTRLAFAGNAPFDASVQNGQIYALWFSGRIDEADRVASRAMQMWPQHPGIWIARLWVLASTGRLDRALRHIDVETPIQPLPPPIVANLRTAISAALSQDPSAIDAAVDRVMARVGQNVSAVVMAMMLLNLLGATDRAFDLANAYYLEQGPVIAAMQWRPGEAVVHDQRRRKTNMLFTPTAARMRQDPRFLHLMERMGLMDYWKRRGVQPDFLT